VKLSVVIPSYNAADTVGELMEALVRERWSEPWEVILADANSTDGTREIVEDYRAGLPSLQFAERRPGGGGAHGMNAGAAAASGESIAFVDADDVVGEGWVAAIGEALREHDFVASQHELERLNEPWLLLARRPHPVIQRVFPGAWPSPYPHTSGSGLAVKRRLHETVGGFDEAFTSLYDIDYCFRLQRDAGAELVPAPNALVHYRYRRAFGAIVRQARNYAEAEALLQKRYGVPGVTRRQRLKWPVTRSRALVGVVPRLARRHGRAELAWLIGWQAGRVRGSIKHRVLAL
jgi:glycosyltransferase involved in cell wall biosynthesis